MTICSAPGCGKLTAKARCDQHPAKKRDHKADQRARGTAAQRGYDHRWRKLSVNYRREHPLCEMYCKDEGKLTPATLVDHIEPTDVRPDLILAEDNLQSGCDSCNARKKVEDAKRYAEHRASKTE